MTSGNAESGYPSRAWPLRGEQTIIGVAALVLAFAASCVLIVLQGHVADILLRFTAGFGGFLVIFTAIAAGKGSLNPDRLELRPLPATATAPKGIEPLKHYGPRIVLTAVMLAGGTYLLGAVIPGIVASLGVYFLGMSLAVARWEKRRRCRIWSPIPRRRGDRAYYVVLHDAISEKGYAHGENQAIARDIKRNFPNK